MLETILFLTIPVSAGLHLWKNSAADNKIRREGLVITEDERSFSEKAISLLKDYAYLALPVYNIVKSFKKFIKDDNEYKNERLSKLRKYERIQDKPILTKNKDFQDDKSKKVQKELPKRIEGNKPNLGKVLPPINTHKQQSQNISDPFNEYIDSVEYTIDSIAPHAIRRILLKRKEKLSEQEEKDLQFAVGYIDLANVALKGYNTIISDYINSSTDINYLELNYDKLAKMISTLTNKHAKMKKLDDKNPELNIIVRKVREYDSVAKLLKLRINTLSVQTTKIMK